MNGGLVTEAFIAVKRAYLGIVIIIPGVIVIYCIY